MRLFIESRLLPGLISGISPGRRKLRLALLLGAVICIILALARPQWGFSWQEVKQKGVDIVVAIDTSKSMLADDIAPNRLARAKLAALDLMQQARSDRLGLVAFAGDAFLQCPLTIDDAAFRQSVESLDVNIIPQGGTALAEAIHSAMTAFKEADNHKVLVLITDGEDQDSNALDAAEKAAQSGLKIFTIGVGTPDGQILRIKDAQGNENYIRDEQGNVVKSHLNERLLQEIAGASQGGFYLPLRGAKTMENLYEKGLAALPKSEHQEKLIRQYQDRYHWPLAIAVLLLIAETLLPERKRQRRDRPTVVATGKPVLQTAALLLLFLPAAWAGSPGSALREYNSGKYEQAMKDYGQLLQRNADDPRLHFNAGAAAYRNQQFDEAAKQFNDAIATPDLKLQSSAYYNHGNSLYRIGEALPDPSKRTEAWEKSLKDYELSMKLDPQDVDAKFNHEFVKKRLEELKQQQSKQDKSNDKNKQDQNKQDQNQNQDQNQKQDQNQQQQNQQQQSQQNPSRQDQSQQNQSQQQKQEQNAQQQQAQQQQAEQDQKQQQAAQQQQKEQQQKQQQAQAAKQSDQSKEEKEKQDAAAYAAGQMTQEQAEQLLDAAKAEEKMLQPKPQGKPSERPKPLKDW
jgi:Ca-activated chloride channel family protein